MSILNTVGKEVGNNILQDSGLDWNVELTQGIYAPQRSGHVASTEAKCATVRTDTNTILGIVSPEYKIVQNSELVHMAERVAGNSNLNVTSAGSLRDGGRVWLAIEADTFTVGVPQDEVKPYLLLTNGHDGLFSLSGTPTSIRPWCENTLNLALSSGKRENMCISIRHKGNMQDKIEALTETLATFYDRTRNFREQANYLAGSSLSEGGLMQYFRNIYNTHVEEIPTEIKDSKTQRADNRWQSTAMKWLDVYDEESSNFGSNLWIAFNAVTNWMDHSKTTFRGEKKLENKFNANFFGASASKKQSVLETTLQIA